jgi:hypothetical protein
MAALVTNLLAAAGAQAKIAAGLANLGWARVCGLAAVGFTPANRQEYKIVWRCTSGIALGDEFLHRQGLVCVCLRPGLA